MALVLKDRVKETSTSTGTGSITLSGASGAFQPFSVIGDGNTTYYAIVGQTTTEWEVGIGTYTASGTTLSRDTVLSSSNSNTLVTFSAGTKDVFCTYPSEKAIYEEANGDTLINAGPITVLGPSVTGTPTAYPFTLGRFYGNEDSFEQIYVQNQYDGVDASADIVAYNNLGDGTNYFIDMGISGSSYTSASYPLFTSNSAYVFNSGLTTGTGAPGEISELFIGTGTLNSDVILFAGGVDVTNEVARIKANTKNFLLGTTSDSGQKLQVAGSAKITGAATFGSTVALNADPTLALQAATKQYVDNQVTAGLHIHEPVRAETTGNLNATYTQGGTTFNITDITSTTTVTTSVNHGLSVNDQIWLYTSAGNGLSTNTAYFVYSTPALNQLTLSLTFGGAQITGLTNATGLTYATRANSGVGATLTNASTQVALEIDGVPLNVSDRVMVRLQTTGSENGVYTVTTVGDGSTNWVLTRAVDASIVSPSDPNGLGTGDYFFTQEGLINAGDSHVLTTEPNTMIIGYTALTYTQFSGAITYVGGTNIDITGQTISVTGTIGAANGGTNVNTVATGDLLIGNFFPGSWDKLALGAAYKSLVVNASGTQVEWNSVNLSSSDAVTGSLGATFGGTGQTAYSLGDMLYASSGSELSKLAGNSTTTKQFLSSTGTGANAQNPAWATLSGADIQAGVVGATFGGTGQTGYSIGDILYADTTTSLAKLTDVAVGNVLRSGGIGAAPSWGKVDLTSTVTGTLGVADGGTGTTSSTGMGNVVLSNSPTLVTPALGTPVSGNFSTGTFTWPTFNQNTTGTADNVSGVVGVANGGTGVTTLTGLAYGNGTSAFTAATASEIVAAIGTTAVTNATNAVSATNATTAGSATYSNSANGAWVSAAIASSTSGSTNSAEFRNNGGTGDTNVAAIALHCTGSYATLMNLRADGYLGWGGWSATSWRAYINMATGDFTANGNVTAYSDPRLKENIVPISNALDKIQTLDGVHFTWKHGIEHNKGKEGSADVGILADQVEAIFPEIVSQSIELEGESYRTVAYDKLVPLLIEAIKELKAEVDALKGK